MKAVALLRVGLTVRDLPAAVAFYDDALGFVREIGATEDASLAAMFGVIRVRVARMRRGRQTLELAQCDPPGAPYPANAGSNDALFQHVALATDDMAGAYARLRRHRFTPISRSGPQVLPGGIVAFKFRDPDGHPLELIAFPEPHPATQGGIDHSAIAVADADRSVAFYAATLGLRVTARQVNTGPAQDALDGMHGTEVDVVALAPEHPAPHVELLGYRTPFGRPWPGLRPADIAASRLIFAVDGIARPRLTHDPDGHALLLLKADTGAA